ncbi:hypothetical protein [Maribacter sp. 2308TA10-17]|uniref:hypothetical protein n=1 Tax=Maribacter sp. 2308TA10-17 TaxID=3386276 RepID=UPI0039BCB19A
MSVFNFDNKTFTLVENSENGSANSKTIFEYKQEGSLVTADYHGGGIKYGKIIARLENDTLHILYQCLTDEDELKAGKATAKVSLNEESKIRLILDWEWLDKNEEKGSSEYIEN